MKKNKSDNPLKASGAANKSTSSMNAKLKFPLFIVFHLATKILRLGIKSHLKKLKVTSIQETPTQLFELLRTKSKSLNLLRLQRVLHLAWLQLVTL